MKKCKRCHIAKPKEEFRKRLHKKCKNGFYFAGKCKDCENEIARSYEKNKRKNDLAYRQAARDRVKKYKKTPKGEKKIRAYRRTIKAKKKSKEYYQKTKEKQYAQRVERMRKDIYNLSDEYIITQLQNPHRKIRYTREEIKNNKEIIELERASILRTRLKKMIEAISDFGICKRCKKMVLKSEFRVQKKTDKRNSHVVRACKKCQAELSTINWAKHKLKNERHNCIKKSSV